MIYVCPGAQVRKPGAHLGLSLSSLLSWSLNIREGGEPGADPEKYQHLRSERRIFNGGGEGAVREMEGKLGMPPEASRSERREWVEALNVIRS